VEIIWNLKTVIWQRGECEVPWTSIEVVEDLEITSRKRTSHRFITSWLNCRHADCNIEAMRLSKGAAHRVGGGGQGK
jgi:hypothetical protein